MASACGWRALGATGEFGLRAVEQPKTIHDVNATILRLIGVDHTKLTWRYRSRDQRLTDVHGENEFTDWLLKVVALDDRCARAVVRVTVLFGADITECLPSPDNDETHGIEYAPLRARANINDKVTVTAEITFSYTQDPPSIEEITDTVINDGQAIELDGSFDECNWHILHPATEAKVLRGRARQQRLGRIDPRRGRIG